MDFTLQTKAGKFYATSGELPTNSYIEIGYYDDNGNAVPVAAIEAKTKEIGEDINEKLIWRAIYNPENPDDYEMRIIK